MALPSRAAVSYTHLVGCIAGAVGNSYMHSNKKGLKKNVGKALRNVGDLMDNVTSMF